jgi:hypothetical protein
MLEFLIFILATIGLTFIITQFYIFEYIRNFIAKHSKFFGKLFNCPACMGMWCGMFIKFLLLIYNHELIILSLIIIPIYGFIGSFICYITYLLIKPLMDKYD